MKKILFGLALTTVLSSAAYAVDMTPPATAGTPVAPHVAGSATSKYTKSNWETLTKAEKIKLLEQKHAEGVKKSDIRWKAMSDDEKIAKYEKRRNKFMETRAKHDAAIAAAAVPAAVPVKQ